LAATARAGALHLEETVGGADASGPLAGGAGGRLGALLRAGPFAGFTGGGGRHGDLAVRALVGLLQAALEAVPQVRTPARTVLARPAPGPAGEGVAERGAEDLGKDVVDGGEALALAEGIAAAAAAVHPGGAEAVVGGALLI